MKKLVKVSAVILVVGVILAAAGALWVRKDGVNIGSVYSVVEENLKLGESNVEIDEPVPFDLSEVTGSSSSSSKEYGLNEFNTIELYCEKCTVDFVTAKSDNMKLSLDGGMLTTAITGGTLHIQAKGTSPGKLLIRMSDTFKGGCVVKAVSSRITMPDIESAMDMSFNLSGSSVTAETLTADSLDIAASSSSFTSDMLSASDGLSISAVSSELKVKGLSCVHSTVKVSNSTAVFKGIVGGFTADAQMSALDAAFDSVTGNITLDMSYGSSTVKVPKGAPLNFRHDESYALFRDKTNPAQNSASNEGTRYTMETNIKFGIVTVEN